MSLDRLVSFALLQESKIRSYFLPWLILIPFYIIYESAINIYYFYNQFNGLFSSPLNKGIYGVSCTLRYLFIDLSDRLFINVILTNANVLYNTTIIRAEKIIH